MSTSPLQHLPFNSNRMRYVDILAYRMKPWAVETLPTGDRDKLKERQGKIRPAEEGEIQKLVEAQNDVETAHFLVNACMHGDLEIAKQIRALKPGLILEFVQEKYTKGINGFTYVGSSPHVVFCNAGSAQEMSELLEWLPSAGLGFMVGLGSDHSMLLNEYEIYKAINYQRTFDQPYGGEHPSLVNGMIRHPELMLSLIEKQKKTAYPEAYKEILCWVTPDMLEQFREHLTPYKSSQVLSLKRYNEFGREQEELNIPLSECTSELMSEVFNEKQGTGSKHLLFNGLEMRTVVEGSELDDPLSQMVLGAQGSKSLHHGFDHPKGMILCRANTDFLTGFEIGGLDERRLSVASKFAAQHFQLDQILVKYGKGDGLSGFVYRYDGCTVGFNGVANLVNNLYELIGKDSTMKEKVMSLIPKPVFDFVIDKYSGSYLKSSSLLALYHTLGRDNTGLRVTASSTMLAELREGGYCFSDESQPLPVGHRMSVHVSPVDLLMATESGMFCKSEYEEKAFAQRHLNAVAMNLWPDHSTPKPKSLEDAIKRASRKKNGLKDNLTDQAIRAYLEHAGVDACTNEAKTVAQWRMLGKLFGQAAIIEHLHKSPGEARGEVLSDQLGL